MIRRLRLKFICVNMLIVTVMMGVIFGLVYHFTQTGLETQSVSMLQSIAAEPFRPNRPGKPPEGVQLPFFMLELDEDGSLTAAGSGYYDLTDEELLNTLVSAADESDVPIGMLPEYGLRYCRSVTPFGERIVFADMSSEQTMLSHLLQTCAVIAVLCFAAFLLISWLLARWAVQPVEKAWQQQRQFVADASHELKTPMTTIAGYTDGILDGTIPPENEKQYLQIIANESRRLSRLVRRMLDVSQLQAMDPLRNGNHFDICESMRRVLISMEKKINDRHLDVEADIPDEPILVLGDNDMITQVLYNLLENAAKFAREGSTLYLGVAMMDGKARVTVRNVGDTIPAEELPLLFERFHKSDKSRSEDKDGYGLGLYIVKTILQQHKEDISVTSENGVTTFTFSLRVE